MVSCTLCGLPTGRPLAGDGGGLFCCPSCREVYALLAEGEVPAQGSAQADPAATCTTTLALSGLWCPSCGWLVEAGLQRTPGVAAAQVSFLQREAEVTFDPAQVDERRLLKQVRRLGYQARPAGAAPFDEEDAHWTRLLISFVLVMHIMVLSFMLYIRQWAGRAAPETEWLAEYFHLMMLILSVPVIVILGLPILRAGLASLLRGYPNTHTLIAIGAFAAIGLSVRNLLAGHGGVYFDTAAVLFFLIALGRWLELRAQKASSAAVADLWQRLPPGAQRVTAGGEETVAADALRTGDRVRVRPGQRFPADGLVASGRGDVDESAISGEPEPVARSAGDRVLAGTTNLDGAFDVIVTASGAATTAGQIGRLLHQALWQRAPAERLADRAAAWMVPVAVLLATGTFFFWQARAGAETGLIYALSVLLIACPCALGIATPLTLWQGLNRAAAAGVILRQTGVLEQLARADRVYFDKTGTLTRRPIRLRQIASGDALESEFLSRVAAVEALSEHPLGQAVVADARARLNGSAGSQTVADFRALPGQGVTARCDGTPVWIGSGGLMSEQALGLNATLAAQAAAWEEAGLRVIYAGWDGQVQGLLGLGEEIRPEAAAALAELEAQQLPLAVLTGDTAPAGRRWQAQLQVPVHAGLRPEEKVARLRAAGRQTVMVGDGLNDGPALAAAGVGLAVCQGSDLAQAAADAVLLRDDLRLVPWLIRLSRQTLRVVRQNLAWAFVYNLIGLGLAASGRLQPALAALFMVASNLIVTANALRLRRFTLPNDNT